MSKEKEIIVASNLSSGHFEDQIPLYSAKQISHYTNSENIDYFIRVLIEELGGKLSVNHIGQRDKTIINEPNKLIISDGNIRLFNDTDINDGDTIYFEHIDRVYCFFIKQDESKNLLISRLHELTRRFWQRYHLDHKVSVELISEEHVHKGTIFDYDINGLGLSIDSDEIELFDTYSIKIFEDNDVIELSGQIVHISKVNNNNIAGFYFEERKNREYLERFFWKNYKTQNEDIEELSKKSDLDKVKQMFENVPIPQLFNKSYLENNENTKTIMLKKGSEYSSGVSIYKYNNRMTMMHTLVLEKDHLFNLPVNLYEYVSNLVLTSHYSDYFSGYWPSKNKYIDRGYTNFVKSNYDDVHHFYKQITIYNCEVKFESKVKAETSYNINLEIIKSEIKDTLGEVFYNAFCLNEDSNDYKIISVSKNNELSGIGICMPEKSKHGVFALSNKVWIVKAGSISDIQDLNDQANEYFRSLGFKNYNLHLFNDFEEIKNQNYVVKSLNDVHFWIGDHTVIKTYINYLKRINFEISLLSSKKAISKKYVKFIKGFSSSFYKRKSLRYHSKELTSDIKVSFDTSFMTIENVRVIDIDTFGMSAEIPSNLSIKSNTETDIIFTLNGDEKRIIKGSIKYCKPKAVTGFKDLSNYVGIEFKDLDLSSKRMIREYCFRKLNPDLSMFTKSDFRSLVNLLEKSKYFEYYDSTKQRQFEQESEPIYTSLELLIPDLARVTVFKNDEDESIIGTHAFYRRSNKTWQLHQLAVDESLTVYKTKFPTRVVLNGAFQYLCLDPDVDYVITYFHNDAAIAKTYFDVKNHHDDPKEYAYIEFTGFLFEGLDKNSYTFPEDYRLSIATKEEKKFLEKEMKRLVQEIEYKALEYNNLSQLNHIKEWNKTGAIKDREVLIIKDSEDEILHFAVCDVSPLGINFIGLVDIFRIFHLKSESSPSSVTMQLLANYAANYYKNKGRSQVYLEVDPNLGEYFSELPVRKLGKNWRLIAARNTFMTALQYFNSRFERLQQRLKQMDKQ